jgi:uncharacterized protein YlxP (DUF503 family)
MLPESHSLKDKRMVLRRIKDRTRQKFNVAIAEVGDGDVWQSALVGFAVIANQRRFVESMVEKIVNFIDAEAKITDEERDFVQYGDEPLSAEDYAHWEPDEDSPPPFRKRWRAPKAKQAEPFPWEEETDGEPEGPPGDPGGAPPRGEHK